MTGIFSTVRQKTCFVKMLPKKMYKTPNHQTPKARCSRKTQHTAKQVIWRGSANRVCSFVHGCHTDLKASITSPQIKGASILPAEIVLSLYLAAEMITLLVSSAHTESPQPWALSALGLPAFSQDAEGVFPILTLDTLLLVLQTCQTLMLMHTWFACSNLCAYGSWEYISQLCITL